MLESGAASLAWNPTAFRDWSFSKAFVLSFLTGACVIQEEAAMFPIHALAPHKGQSVLDLCAAPGNKAAQIASMVGHEGLVVANDVSASRMNVVRGLVDRVGFPNVLLSNHDAATFPETGFLYDAVVADVPCSCEGTSRKHPAVLRIQHSQQRAQLAQLQEKILRKAIRLTKPGGKIVYATCTYAPEENERVLHAVMTAPEENQDVRLVEVSLPDLQFSPGLTEWRGEAFHPSMQNAVRIWPHHQDTGGFFFGILQKKRANQSDSVLSPTQNTFSSYSKAIDLEMEPWRFHDLDDAGLAALGSIHTGGKYDRLVTRNSFPEGLMEITRGMTGLNRKSETPRWSTSLAQTIGGRARAGIVTIRREDALSYFLRKAVPFVSIVAPEGPTRFVLVRIRDIPPFDGRALGDDITLENSITVGLGHISAREPTLVESMFPKNWGALNVEQWISSQTRKGAGQLLKSEAK